MSKDRELQDHEPRYNPLPEWTRWYRVEGQHGADWQLECVFHEKPFAEEFIRKWQKHENNKHARRIIEVGR